MLIADSILQSTGLSPLRGLVIKAVDIVFTCRDGP